MDTNLLSIQIYETDANPNQLGQVGICAVLTDLKAVLLIKLLGTFILFLLPVLCFEFLMHYSAHQKSKSWSIVLGPDSITQILLPEIKNKEVHTWLQRAKNQR